MCHESPSFRTMEEKVYHTQLENNRLTKQVRAQRVLIDELNRRVHVLKIESTKWQERESKARFKLRLLSKNQTEKKKVEGF